MSINAIALLPGKFDLQGEIVEEGWFLGEGPGGGNGLWYRLRDGVLLNVRLSINAKDSDLFDAIRMWIGTPPSRIWIFPDTSIPIADSIISIQKATQEVGRWVQQSVPERLSILEDLGFSLSEIEEWQREINSGNPNRIQDAISFLEKRLEGKDTALLQSLLDGFLKHK